MIYGRFSPQSLLLFTILIGVNCSWHSAVDSNGEQPASSVVHNESNVVTPKTTGTKEIRLIWEGVSKGFKIRWTTDDLFIMSKTSTNESPELIFSSSAAVGFAAAARDSSSGDASNGCFFPNTGVCYNSREFKLISVFGHYLTFEDKYDAYSGKGETSTDIRYTTIDITKKDKPVYISEKKYDDPMFLDDRRNTRAVSLEEIFDSKEIIREISSDKDAMEALDANGIVYRDQTASQVINQIRKLELGNLLFKNDSFVIDTGLLTRFTVTEVTSDGKAVVELMMPSSGGYASPDPTYIYLTLKIPEKIRRDLLDAQSTKVGFLKKYAIEKFIDQSTTIRKES